MFHLYSVYLSNVIITCAPRSSVRSCQRGSACSKSAKKYDSSGVTYDILKFAINKNLWIKY
jgi:hypothetical protein